MKKITLLVLLMWPSLFYAQEYLNEGFEGGTFPPTGWVDQAGSGDTNNYPWATRTDFSSTPNDFVPIGTKSAFYNELFNLTHGEDDMNPVAKDKWLISPAMNFTSATNPELTYYETVNYPDFPATQGVYYSTDYSGDPNTATWTLINDTFDFVYAESLNWKQRGAFDLSAANGNTSVVIGFRYEGTNNSEWFLDNILVREAPTCIEPNAVATISNITSTGADFTWTSGSGGTETQWDVEIVNLTAGETHDVDGTVTENTTSNPFSFTLLTPGNSYAAYVRADCGGSESDWVGPFTFDTASSNDDCSGATSVTHESNIATPGAATATNGTINGATGTTTVSCAGGTPNNDVWFSFEATSSSATVLVESSATFDVVLEVYDACGGTQIACVDNGIENNGEEVNLYSLNVGTTYYVRVYDWYSTTPANGDFSLKVYRNTPLDIEDGKDLAEFKFYPNPVQDKLNLRAQDNIQKISVYNMLGQEVLRQAPNNNTTEVDMSALQTGSYFVKVTINGITETKQIIKR